MKDSPEDIARTIAILERMIANRKKPEVPMEVKKGQAVVCVNANPESVTGLRQNGTYRVTGTTAAGTYKENISVNGSGSSHAGSRFTPLTAENCPFKVGQTVRYARKVEKWCLHTWAVGTEAVVDSLHLGKGWVTLPDNEGIYWQFPMEALDIVDEPTECSFKKGETVVCIDADRKVKGSTVRLTNGRTYVVDGTFRNHIHIIDDNGNRRLPYADRFIRCLTEVGSDAPDWAALSKMLDDEIQTKGDKMDTCKWPRCKADADPEWVFCHDHYELYIQLPAVARYAILPRDADVHEDCPQCQHRGHAATECKCHQTQEKDMSTTWNLTLSSRGQTTDDVDGGTNADFTMNLDLTAAQVPLVRDGILAEFRRIKKATTPPEAEEFVPPLIADVLDRSTGTDE